MLKRRYLLHSFLWTSLTPAALLDGSSVLLMSCAQMRQTHNLNPNVQFGLLYSSCAKTWKININFSIRMTKSRDRPTDKNQKDISFLILLEYFPLRQQKKKASRGRWDICRALYNNWVCLDSWGWNRKNSKCRRSSECCWTGIITHKKPCQRERRQVGISIVPAPHLTGRPRPFSSGFWPQERPRSACRRWERIAGRSRCHPASLAVRKAGRRKNWLIAITDAQETSELSETEAFIRFGFKLESGQESVWKKHIQRLIFCVLAFRFVALAWQDLFISGALKDKQWKNRWRWRKGKKWVVWICWEL